MKKSKELLEKYIKGDFKKLYKKNIKQKMLNAVKFNSNQLSDPYTKTKYNGELKLYNKKDKKYLKSGQTWVEIEDKIYLCHGFGIQANIQIQEIYAGEWINGYRSGKGMEWNIQGDKYTGYWKGRRFGYGKQIYSDGGIQEGIFDETMNIGTEINLDGIEDYFLLKKIEKFSFTTKKVLGSTSKPRVYKGKLHYKDGSVYEGEFTSPNPGPNGKGFLTKKNGDVIKGLWKNGEFLG